jgi:hypothetical protein
MVTGASASSSHWKGNGNLYCQMEKNINGGWTLSAPVLEMTVTKAPLLIDFEGRMDYTMPRGGSMFNHNSYRAELHTGWQVGAWWMTYSVGLINYIEGNDYRVPAGVTGVNTIRGGISF